MPPRTASSITPPRLADELTDWEPVVGIDEIDWTDVRVRADLSGWEVGDVDGSGVHLVDARLTGAVIGRIRLVDALVERCDLSGALLTEGALTRVELRECRMTGAVLADAQLRDVRFVGCKLDDANLRMSKGERVELADCLLRNADLSGAKLPGLRVRACDLTGAVVHQADLHGASLHGSCLDELRGVLSLRGAVIASDQVVPLAQRLLSELKIVVDDEPDKPDDAQPPVTARKRR